MRTGPVQFPAAEAVTHDLSPWRFPKALFLIGLFEAFRQREAAHMYDEPRIDPEDMERILFEWAYPRIARHCRDRGTPYPPLREDGGLPQFSSR